MAESVSFRRSVYLGSDQVPESFCEPCYEVHDKIKPVVGYCQNCNEDLCLECHTGHLRRKLFQNHKLVNKSTRPKTKPAPPTKPQTGVECHLHHGETVESFCHTHSQFCCKVCLALNHLSCKTEEISKLATNIGDSQELQHIIKLLDTLKKGFNGSLDKTGANESVIQKNHSNAINEMKKLREEFDNLMTKTEAQADDVKEADFNKIEKLAATCDIAIEQINKLTINLEKLKEEGETERLFVSMKQAESQLKSLEENLEKIDKENTVREYTFKPDARLKALFNDCKELGQLLFEKSRTARIPQQMKAITLSDQKKKKPNHLKDILVKSSSDRKFDINCSLVLTSKHILITDMDNSKLKLIDTNQDKIISELKLPGNPIGITKVKEDEVAVTIQAKPNKIQFVSVNQKSLSIGREISMNGYCRGIAYNDKDQTFVVTYVSPANVEIINMAGTVVKRLDIVDSKGMKRIYDPRVIALSPTMTEMYITEQRESSIVSLSMNGDVKAVYKNDTLKHPADICVHKSGLVYVSGQNSDTVHQLDPNSCDFQLLLEQKDGLNGPMSISYCELEDKLYIGMWQSSVLKVFEMK